MGYNSPWANALDEAEDELLRLASYVAASNKNQELTKRTTLRAEVTNAINAANSDSSLVPGVMPIIQDYVARTGDSSWASTQQASFSAIQSRHNKTRQAYANANNIRASLDAIDPLGSSGNGDGTNKIMQDVDNATQSFDDLHRYDASNRLRQDVKKHQKDHQFYQNTMNQYDYTANEILKDGTITDGVNAPGWQIDPGNPNSGTLEAIKFHIQNKDAASAKREIANMKASTSKRIHLGANDNGTPKMGTYISRDHAYERDPDNNMRYIMENGRPVLKEGVINDERYPGKFIRLDDLPAQPKVGDEVPEEYTNSQTQILNSKGITIVKGEPGTGDQLIDAAGNPVSRSDGGKILELKKTEKALNTEKKLSDALELKGENKKLAEFDSEMTTLYGNLHAVYENTDMKAAKNPSGKWKKGTNDTIKNMYNDSNVLYKMMSNKNWAGDKKHASVAKISEVQKNIETYIQEIFDNDEKGGVTDDYDVNATLRATYINGGSGIQGAKKVLSSSKFSSAAGHQDPDEAIVELNKLFDLYGWSPVGNSSESKAQAAALSKMWHIWTALEREKKRRQIREINLNASSNPVP